MARMLEYLNPQSHAVQLSSPEHKIIKVAPNGKVILSDWYLTYCPKYLRVVREIGPETNPVVPKVIHSAIKYKKDKLKATPVKPSVKRKLKQAQAGAKPKRHKETRRPNKTGASSQTISRFVEKKQIVGRPIRENTKKLLVEAYQNTKWSISNNVGIGILSFNRLSSLQRLINSIRMTTDLRKVTVFVSDESTDKDVKTWLQKQTDIVVMTNQKRLGIAGNSNRLLRCLSRFKHCFLLNDDVEILSAGWTEFYINASRATGFKHFCYHQQGVYGAKRDGKISQLKGYRVETITEKPHGAILYFTDEVLKTVGFFDEQFGKYGIEHVDWSERVSFSKIQTSGYHDVLGSEQYFKIHKETSIVPERTTELSKNRATWKKIRNPNRVYVEPSYLSNVPSISVIIPLRNIERQQATESIINSIRSQLFPNIEIILVEQDGEPKFKTNNVQPINYLFAKNKYPTQPFTKAMAFNLGVAKAKYPHVVLQDADIICPVNYLSNISKLFDRYDGIHIGSKVLYLTKESSEQVVRTGIITDKNDCDRAVGYFEGGSLACTKKTYFAIGGFNEMFEGYGVEDCDFFDRLKNFSKKFFNERTEDFVHLWHGRTPGWDQFHRRNKKIITQINHKFTKKAYVSSLVSKLKTTHSGLFKELGL